LTVLEPLEEGGVGVPVINGAVGVGVGEGVGVGVGLGVGVGVGVGVGAVPTLAVCPVKARLFKSTLALDEPKIAFAVMMSSLPSAFTSPKLTEEGLDPVAKVA
jgi:hypothetical protein